MGNDVQTTEHRGRDERTRTLAAVADLRRQDSVVALRRSDPRPLELLVGLVPTGDGQQPSPWATDRLYVQAFTARSSSTRRVPIRRVLQLHLGVHGSI